MSPQDGRTAEYGDRFGEVPTKPPQELVEDPAHSECARAQTY